jgi:uncharacterized protein YndB with AHSA1/START domain
VARNTTTIGAAPAAVWAVLEDPYAFPKWVVGTDRTLEADPHFPAPGSAFQVHVALGIKDQTKVIELVPGRCIKLHAGVSFLGPAEVTIELEAVPGGTQVTIVEDPVGKVLPLKYFPPVQLAIKLRNLESLRRLKRLALARAVPV